MGSEYHSHPASPSEGLRKSECPELGIFLSPLVADPRLDALRRLQK